jgi:hypothetical protein
MCPSGATMTINLDLYIKNIGGQRPFPHSLIKHTSIFTLKDRVTAGNNNLHLFLDTDLMPTCAPITH